MVRCVWGDVCKVNVGRWVWRGVWGGGCGEGCVVREVSVGVGRWV